jgi:hypothetical protein
LRKKKKKTRVSVCFSSSSFKSSGCVDECTDGGLFEEARLPLILGQPGDELVFEACQLGQAKQEIDDRF